MSEIYINTTEFSPDTVDDVYSNNELSFLLGEGRSPCTVSVRVGETPSSDLFEEQDGPTFRVEEETRMTVKQHSSDVDYIIETDQEGTALLGLMTGHIKVKGGSKLKAR